MGFIECKIKKIYSDFIDAICAKTNREITFQLKNKISDKLKNWRESLIKFQIPINVRCRIHDEENFYWFMGISSGQHLGHRKAIKKEIAYGNLIKEVEKDYNPINTGSIKQKLVLGRAGLPTSKNTSGKIGSSLSRTFIDLKPIQ